jgi:hypothetical protein
VRIVFDPDQMVRTARLMTEAAEDYEMRSAHLVTSDLPVMPPDIALRVDAGLRSAAAALDDTAIRLQAEALMLRARGSLVAGDTGFLASTALSRFSAAVNGALPGRS